MTEYKMKEFISVFQSNHKIDTSFRQWIFPYRIVFKDPKTKKVERIQECGWFSHKLKKILDDVEVWDMECGEK